MQISVYIAQSLDGFIARKDGGLDWLPAPDGGEGGEDYGFAEFFATVSCLVMGRGTFEKVLTFDHWPYGDKRVVVMSNTLAAVPELVEGRLELFAGEPTELIDKLRAEGEAKLYVDGGSLIQSFLRAGLIDDMVITTVPVLIGSGIPLFGPLESDLRLQHRATKAFGNGLVQSRYRCVN